MHHLHGTRQFTETTSPYLSPDHAERGGFNGEGGMGWLELTIKDEVFRLHTAVFHWLKDSVGRSA